MSDLNYTMEDLANSIGAIEERHDKLDALVNEQRTKLDELEMLFVRRFTTTIERIDALRKEAGLD